MRRKALNGLVGLAVFAAAMSMSIAPVVQPLTVVAAEDSIVVNKKGTFQVTRKDTKGTAIKGAQFTAYKVMSLTPGTDAGDWADYAVMTPYATTMQGITADNLGQFSAVKTEALINSLEKDAQKDTGILSNVTGDNGIASFGDLALGWYLIVETTTPNGSFAIRPFLVAVPSTNNIIDPNGTATVGTEWDYSIEAVPKATSITVDKNIINGQAAKDSAFVTDGKEYTGKNDTVALDDYVEYKIESVVPDLADTYFENNGAPVYKFEDTLSDGLTIQNDAAHPIKVVVDGKEVAPGSGADALYTVAAAETTGSTAADMTVTFTNKFLQTNAYRGKDISIIYFAKVNAKAVMGTAGNTNDVKLSYTGNPTNGLVTENSPVDGPDSYVYTYGISVDKFAEGAAALSGAKFELYKDVALTQKVAGADGNTTQITNADGMLSFPRLDAGTYYLKEVESPSGYTLLTNPIKVEIIPTVDKDGKVTSGAFTLKVDGKAITATTGNNVTQLDTANGIATVAVQNHKGFTLPATGGSGILMIVGISAAGILTASFFMLKSQKAG